MFGELKDASHRLIPRDDYHVNVAMRVALSEFEFAVHADAIEHRVQSEMREQLAHFVAKARMQTRDEEYTREFRLDLFVFSPDEFWRIVERAAMELNHQKNVFGGT